MKKVTSILSIAMAIFILASCSKEKRIERSLHKKEGQWAVKSFVIDNYVDGQFTDTDVYAESGQTMTFDKDGNLAWVWKSAGYSETFNCKWSSTETQLTVIMPASFDETFIFDILNWEKKSMNLETTVESSSTIGTQTNTFKEVYKISLEKL